MRLRVAVDQQQVGSLADLDRAGVLVLLQQARRLDGGRRQGFGRREAGLDNRNNTNSYGYQSFVYTGPDSLFALTATLDFTSSASPVAASIPQGNEIAGEGSVFVRIGLMDTSAVAGLVSAMDILNYGFTSGCGTAGIYGVASYDFATAAGGAGNFVDIAAARRIRINPRMQGMSHGTAGMPAIQPGIE